MHVRGVPFVTNSGTLSARFGVPASLAAQTGVILDIFSRRDFRKTLRLIFVTDKIASHAKRSLQISEFVSSGVLVACAAGWHEETVIARNTESSCSGLRHCATPSARARWTT
ncbi:hypothetical protein BDN67DRAFT_973028 [Paxillus ammoniavirescens]|nr:hypothetical protein BDN67DRAFT_973028 [Paxillus ammoniavirescens]